MDITRILPRPFKQCYFFCLSWKLIRPHGHFHFHSYAILFEPPTRTSQNLQQLEKLENTLDCLYLQIKK